jgi:hypothetical protein
LLDNHLASCDIRVFTCAFSLLTLVEGFFIVDTISPTEFNDFCDGCTTAHCPLHRLLIPDFCTSLPSLNACLLLPTLSHSAISLNNLFPLLHNSSSAMFAHCATFLASVCFATSLALLPLIPPNTAPTHAPIAVSFSEAAFPVSANDSICVPAAPCTAHFNAHIAIPPHLIAHIQGNHAICVVFPILLPTLNAVLS